MTKQRNREWQLIVYSAKNVIKHLRVRNCTKGTKELISLWDFLFVMFAGKHWRKKGLLYVTYVTFTKEDGIGYAIFAGKDSRKDPYGMIIGGRIPGNVLMFAIRAGKRLRLWLLYVFIARSMWIISLMNALIVLVNSVGRLSWMVIWQLIPGRRSISAKFVGKLLGLNVI